MPARTPQEIHALIEAALNARDRDAFADLHEEGATVVVPPAGERVSGRAAIRAATEAVFALEPRARIEVLDKVERADGLALTHARWTVEGTDGGRRVEMSGRGTIVSRRQADGRWLIVLENSMSPE